MTEEKFMEQCRTLPEIEMFMMCQALGGMSDKNQTGWQMYNQQITLGKIPITKDVQWRMSKWKRDIEDVRRKIKVLQNNLKRFGVHGTGDFDLWHAWWNKYFLTMGDQNFRELIIRKENKQDITYFYPSGHWRTFCQTPKDND